MSGESKSQPNLKMFDAEITKYRKLQAEIQKFEKQKSVTWLQINLTPINQALESWIAQWVMRYMNHVTDDSLQKLSDLQVFMVAANAGRDCVEQPPERRLANPDVLNITGLPFCAFGRARQAVAHPPQHQPPQRVTLALL